MRFTKISLVAALAVLVAGAAGLVGTWAVALAAVILLVDAFIGAIALDKRDVTSIEGLVVHTDQSRRMERLS